MENASKALIIAAEILIGILVLSIMATVFLAMGKTGESYEAAVGKTEVDKINAYFTKYMGRTDIKAHEVVTAIKYAQELNKTKGKIEVNATGIIGDATLNFDEIEFIKKDNNSVAKSLYKCTISFSDSNGMVKVVNFNKMP